MRKTMLALVLGLALVAAGVAWAGDDTPAAKPADPKPAAEAPATQAPATQAPATKTPSPIASMMKWFADRVVALENPCPSTAEGEKAWRDWFASKTPALPELRDALVADGWNADRFVAFFKQMAAQGSCKDCDKAREQGAAAPTGDAGAAGSPSCSKCKGDCGKCKDGAGKCKDGAGKCAGDCGKCKDGDGAGKCKSGECGKCKEKAAGAAAPAGDAGTSGAEGAKCPCTGKARSECPGCDKPACPCGKDKGAPAAK